MEPFDAYSHAIASLAATAVIGMIMGPLSAQRKMVQGVPAGGTPKESYADPAYRHHRAYLNMTESIGFFTAVVVAAILAGAAPFWINLFAVLFLLARIAHAYVHIKGIGAENQGTRSFVFAFGWLMAILIGLFAFFAAF